MSNPAIYSKTQVYFKTSPSSSFIEIPGVVSISGPTVSRETLDITNMSSEAMEFMPAALYNPGTMDLELQYKPSNVTHSLIMSRAQNTGSADIFGMRFSDGSIWNFSASFVELSVKADNPAANVFQGSAKLQLTGAIITAGSLS